MSRILEGRQLAATIRANLRTQVEQLKAGQSIDPCLAIVVATAEADTTQYVRSLRKAALEVGIETQTVQVSDPSQATIARALQQLADDKTVHGIILQTPLPPGINGDDLFPLIPPEKDVDGVNPLSAGRLVNGLPAFAPATAEAVLTMLNQYHVPLEGARAVVVGRSRIVGKPVADLLLSANATVTICHTKTRDLALVTKTADILVVAAGQAGLITANHSDAHSVIIDVGTNVNEQGAVTGDVDFEAVKDHVRAISPVPGGVGPVTTAVLLKHTVAVAQKVS